MSRLSIHHSNGKKEAWASLLKFSEKGVANCKTSLVLKNTFLGDGIGEDYFMDKPAQDVIEVEGAKICEVKNWLTKNIVQWVKQEDGDLECIFFGAYKAVKKQNEQIFKIYTKKASSITQDGNWVAIDIEFKNNDTFLLLEHFAYEYVHQENLKKLDVSITGSRMQAMFNPLLETNRQLFLLFIIFESYGLYSEITFEYINEVLSLISCGTLDASNLLVREKPKNEFHRRCIALANLVTLTGKGWIGGAEDDNERKWFETHDYFFESFKKFLDKDILSYYAEWKGEFSLKEYVSFARINAESLPVLRKWREENPNKSLLILHGECTQKDVENLNLFSYENLLNPQNPIARFESKAQIRKLLDFPYSMLKSYFTTMSSLRLGQEVSAVEEERCWVLFLRWIERSRLTFTNTPHSAKGMHDFIMKIVKLIPVMDEVDMGCLAYGMDILFRELCKDDSGLQFGIGGRWAADRFFAAMTHTAKVDELLDFMKNKDAWGERYNAERITSKTTAKSLKRLVDEWHKDLQVVDLEKLRTDKSRIYEYTHPSLKEHVINGVVFTPIKTNLELMEHGIQMDNCAYSYENEVREGVYIFFAARHGEETYMVSFEVVGAITLDECKGFRNSIPDDEVYAAAEMLEHKLQNDEKASAERYMAKKP